MWVAVDKDGTEVCSNVHLGRYSDYIKAWNKIDRNKGVREEDLFDEADEKYCYWTDESSNYNTEIYDGVECFNTVVYLPQGTIEKLTGKKLTWDDNPIEIE